MALRSGLAASEMEVGRKAKRNKERRLECPASRLMRGEKLKKSESMKNQRLARHRHNLTILLQEQSQGMLRHHYN